MTYKSTALPVAGRTVRIVNLNNRLYVPMRFFVEGTLGMQWGAQRKRLAGMTGRWKMVDLAVTANHKTVQQPCLPVGLLLPYLWLIRPSRPEIFERIERLRDRWEESLLAFLKFDGSELANTGAFLAAEIERSTLPLIAQIGKLEKQLSEASRPVLNVLDRPVAARWNGEITEAAVFLEMARLNNDGMNNAEIAATVNKSRTTVSLFLDGKYKSGRAKDAWATLQASGWKKY